jgi:uncharacterized membrane protein
VTMRPLALLALVACGAGPQADPRCDVAEPLTYEGWGRGFVDKHCVGCHSGLIPPAQRRGAPSGVDLDTYRGVLQWAERIEARSLVAASGDGDDAMPPGGGLTDEELLMLEEWLRCGVYPDKAALEAAR